LGRCGQKIFSQEIRFKNGDDDFPEWVEQKIYDVYFTRGKLVTFYYQRIETSRTVKN